MVNIVTVDHRRYLVDVGYGANNPCRIVPIERGIEFENICPVRGKLEHKALPQHTDPEQRVWVYSTQENRDGPWTEQYAFVDMEFFPADFEVMNLSTMTAPESYFVKTVLATKVLLNPRD